MMVTKVLTPYKKVKTIFSGRFESNGSSFLVKGTFQESENPPCLRFKHPISNKYTQFDRVEGAVFAHPTELDYGNIYLKEVTRDVVFVEWKGGNRTYRTAKGVNIKEWGYSHEVEIVNNTIIKAKVKMPKIVFTHDLKQNVSLVIGGVEIIKVRKRNFNPKDTLFVPRIMKRIKGKKFIKAPRSLIKEKVITFQKFLKQVYK